MRESTGPLVQAEWERAVAVTGEPRAILSDAGTDLKKAWEGFRPQHAAVAELSDIKHKLALFVKAALEADPRWSAFVGQVGRAKAQLQQTELVSLIPPSLKEKARFMNVDALIRWGGRVLHYLDTPPRQRCLAVAADRVETKLGWLREHRAAIRHWRAMMAVVNATLEVVRRDGYHRAAATVLRATRPAGHRRAQSPRGRAGGGIRRRTILGGCRGRASAGQHGVLGIVDWQGQTAGGTAESQRLHKDGLGDGGGGGGTDRRVRADGAGPGQA